MKQKFKLALVDTDKASNLSIQDDGSLYMSMRALKSDGICANKLLVALSDEPPNMGDWYLDSKNIPSQRQFLDDSLYVGDKKITASNSKEITPNNLFHPTYLESYAKGFNNGNAPEWVELEMDYFDDRDMITNEDVHKPKTNNNHVIVAENEKEQHSPYCKICTSCGEDGCCSAISCKHSKDGAYCESYLKELQFGYLMYKDIYEHLKDDKKSKNLIQQIFNKNWNIIFKP